MKSPGINIDILITKNDKILLGLLTKKWFYKGQQVYGVPGRDIFFGQTIGETVIKNVKEELDCKVKNYKIICVNANYALNNHYIGIGVIAEITGEPKNLQPDDWEKWEWFAKNHIPENLFPATKNLIDCYIKNKVNVAE